jgi:isopenicillin-N epimerase
VTTTFGRHRLADWPLDPTGAYLNHGTVGVTPLRVMEAQRQIRDEIERHPSRFLLREAAGRFATSTSSKSRLRQAADRVAAFLGARGEDLVFVDNVTAGANAVLRSFPFEPGDEILVSDLGYGGVTRAAMFAVRTRGAVVRTVEVPWPFGAERIADALVEAAGPRTRLAIVDHVSSGSALVLPVASIAERLKERGVPLLVDGAHAPGAIPVDIPSLGVDWYVANLHKWAWAPRSTGILWTRPERQADIHPAVISWGLDEGYTAEFDWVGTRDLTPYLASTAALDLLDEWGGAAVREYNHSLAWRAGHYLAERWGTTFDVPEAMIGTMAALPLPEAWGRTAEEARAVRDSLLFDHGIEVQMHDWRGRLWIRVAAQIYNDMDDIERLAAAMQAVQRRTMSASRS